MSPSRNLLTLSFLGFILILTGVLAVGWSVWWLNPIYWLGRFTLFHIVAHAGIFAGVVFLTYSREGSALRLWLVVLAGSVGLELVQIVIGGVSLFKPLLLDSLFDIGVDISGAAVCWLMLRRSGEPHQFRKVSS